MSGDRMLPITIVGARGRMGRALIRAVFERDDMVLERAIARSGAPGVGDDVGPMVGLPEMGVELTDRLCVSRRGVVVDFSLPHATAANVAFCLSEGVPLVLGTTGTDDKTRTQIEAAASSIPIVFAANFSVGVTLLCELAAIASRALGEEWDAEVLDIHHRHKRDAPSGTALRIADSVATARDRSLEDIGKMARGPSDGPRSEGELGITALRGGDVVGEHTVYFFGPSERIELVHRAQDRAIFARGALKAARWVHDRPPGLYDMPDVLGFSKA